jgi:hypothetical protein
MAANERTLMSRKLPVCPNRDTADPFLFGTDARLATRLVCARILMRLRVPAFRRNKRKKGGVCNSISGERGDVAPFPDPLYADGTAPKNPLMLH